MDQPHPINPAARVVGGGVFLASVVALYFELTEPFAGGRLPYVGRLLGPVVIMLISLQLFLQRRAHPLFLALLIVLSVLSLVFVLSGLGR